MSSALKIQTFRQVDFNISVSIIGVIIKISKDCQKFILISVFTVNHPSCGLPVVNSDFSSINIVGGGPATPGAWPWQVLI